MGASDSAIMQNRKSSNAYRHPRRGLTASICNGLANSKYWASFRRAVFKRLPFITLESSVRDVVYLSWCVPVANLRAQIPPGLTVLERDGYTILTLLSYRHEHFGPAFLGKARRLLPSPLQSNWRLYVTHLRGEPVKRNTVLFLKNIFNNAAYALGSRLFSDALPSHLAAEFQHEVLDGHYSTRILAGHGSAPELESHVFPPRANTGQAPKLSPEFSLFFDDWQEAVKTLALQDEAICTVSGTHKLARAGINLPVDLKSVTPLAVQRVTIGQYLRGLGVEGQPLCFGLPSVNFKVLWEKVEG